MSIYFFISVLLVVLCHTAVLSVQKTFKENIPNIRILFSVFFCIHCYDMECCIS